MPSRFEHIDLIDDDTAAILRAKTGAERLAIADRMWRFAQEMLRMEIIRERPDLSGAEIQVEAARRISRHGFEEECYKKLPLSLFL